MGVMNDIDNAITAASLGSRGFRADHGLRLAYVSGAMYKGIASKEIVIAMGRTGLLGYFGTGGVDFETIEATIVQLREALAPDQPFGLNLLAGTDSAAEERLVSLYLRHDLRFVEASAYTQVTPALVRLRLSGARRMASGAIEARRVMAKVSRPEVAEAFMSPAPAAMVARLRDSGQITAEEAELAPLIPMAQEICVEADSGGHTDQGVAYVLMPAMLALRNRLQAAHGYAAPLRLGAAGGIGTPEAAAAAFILGADFILTGSINQCTVEAGTSDAVKDMLQQMNVQDTAYAPAGDMFELGAKVQVLKKGLFFPTRAAKLQELYMRHDALEDIDAKTRQQIEQKYFQRSFDEVWEETRAHYLRTQPALIESALKHPKQKMALVFKWYFIHSTRLAMQGSTQQRADYQVQCGPALGAFNQWVRGTALEDWRQRHVAQLGDLIMQGAAELLEARLQAMREPSSLVQ